MNRRSMATVACALMTALSYFACGGTVAPSGSTGSGGTGGDSSSMVASSTTGWAMACVPGQVINCGCGAADPTGTQTCAADGSKYGPCVCCLKQGEACDINTKPCCAGLECGIVECQQMDDAGHGPCAMSGDACDDLTPETTCCTGACDLATNTCP